MGEAGDRVMGNEWPGVGWGWEAAGKWERKREEMALDNQEDKKRDVLG